MTIKLILFDLNGTLIRRSNNKKIIYFRPYINIFNKLNNVKFGIYSSMPYNSFKDYIKFIPIPISVVYDRSYTIKDNQSSKPYDTIRDLRKIMNSSYIKNNNIKKKEILMIDDSCRKVRYMTTNSIVIDKYYNENQLDTSLLTLYNKLKLKLLVI